MKRKTHIGTTVEEKITKIRSEKNLEIKKEEDEDDEDAADPSDDEDDSDEQVKLRLVITHVKYFRVHLSLR
jgi:hypothetical protein